MSPQASESDRFHHWNGDYEDPIPPTVSSGKITEKDAELITTYLIEWVTSGNINGRGRFRSMRGLIEFCKIPSTSWRPGYKFPKLNDAYEVVTGHPLIAAHDALVDTEGCKEIFFTALDKGVIRFNSEHPSIVTESMGRGWSQATAPTRGEMR